MQAQRVKLTKRAVDAAQLPEFGETWLWDSELAGFFLRVRPSGRKVYAVRYRLGSKQTVHTIGPHGSPWTPEDARKAAHAVLARVRDGHDPASEKKAARNVVTVAGLVEAYLSDGPATKPAKRLSTWAADASNLKRHIVPLIGRKVADDVTKADAARSIRDIADGKTAADERTGVRGRARVTGGDGVARRTRLVAAAMYAWGVEHGLVTGNPYSRLKLAAAPVRERFLSLDEAGRFLAALIALEGEAAISPTFADALRVLLLTGARKTEVLGLRWTEVDFGRRLLTLPPERTKAGGKTGERRIFLSPPAMAILDKRRPKDEASSPFVFPAGRGDGHAIGLRRPLVRAMERAQLSDVRVHDLRHSFASFAVADGASLFLLGKLLGHASTRTTERYAHLSGDPLQDAAASIGRHLAPDQDNGPSAELIPLANGRR